MYRFLEFKALDTMSALGLSSICLMFLYVPFVVIALVADDDCPKPIKVCAKLFSTIALLDFVFFLIFSTFSGFIYPKIKGYEEYYYPEIVSLEKENELQSSFVLGSGSIEGGQSYYFYTTTDKGYKLEKLDCDSTYIIEDDNIKPCVYYKRDKGEKHPSYIIYVPTGTIIKEFKG